MIKNKKYLPIGTICTIKNNNDIVMIIGYFSTEFHSKLKVYDYIGCFYPDGLLLKNNICSFNHEDIINIEHEGYRNELFYEFNDRILEPDTSSNSNIEDKIFSNIEFDENGVVIFAETKNDIDGSPSIKNNVLDVKNPFLREINEETSNTINEDINVENWPIFSNIKFDENGIIIEE